MLLVLALIAAAPDPLASMAQTRDEVQGVTWFHDRAGARAHASDSVSCSFARFSNGYGPLRLTIVHSGKSIDPETATFVVDGSTFVLRQARRGLRGCSWRSTANASGVVVESCELSISAEHPDLLAALLAAKNVKVHLQGDRAHDFTVPKTQLDAIRRVHAAWRAATDQPAR
jgi:hypothetical protein